MLLILVAVAAIFTIQSCGKDACKTVVCQNKGVCIAGICSCVPGYEGKNCDSVWSQKYVGNWQVSETLKDSAGALINQFSYTLVGQNGGQPSELLLYNLEGFVDSIYATMTSYRTFTFPAQTRFDGSFSLENGNGSLNDSFDTVSMNYVYRDNGFLRRGNLRWVRI